MRRTMATLVIKNVPDELHARLKQQAHEHRRSLAKEALTLLEHAVTSDESLRAGRRRLPTPIQLTTGPMTLEDIEAAISAGRD